jgi:hypothetical protein
MSASRSAFVMSHVKKALKCYAFLRFQRHVNQMLHFDTIIIIIIYYLFITVVTINTVFKLTEELANAQTIFNQQNVISVQVLMWQAVNIVSYENRFKNYVQVGIMNRALSTQRQQNTFLIQNTVKVRNRVSGI